MGNSFQGQANLYNEQIRRLLRYSDVLLSTPEQVLLTLFSGFRGPVTASTLASLLNTARVHHISSLRALDDTAFNALVVRLENAGLLHHDLRTDTYTPHPLVHAHFLARLGPCLGEERTEEAENYYTALADHLPELATLEELRPLTESACQTSPPDRRSGVNFGAEIMMLEAFFPEGDITQEPQVADAHRKSWVLNEVGLNLTQAGGLRQAVSFFERARLLMLAEHDWYNACVSTVNLVNVYHALGNLEMGAITAGEALDLARRAEDPVAEQDALVCGAWAAHLYGDVEMAGTAFERAARLTPAPGGATPMLRGEHGIQHAAHLLRIGRHAQARRITEANLAEWAVAYGRLQDESRCHHLLGDLEAASGDLERAVGKARAHYDKALWIAQTITHLPALIEALLARGRWGARRTGSATPQVANTALSDLGEALSAAIQNDYRRFEIDIRLALARVYHATDDVVAARQEAERAHTLSEQTGYHWGAVDADDVLTSLGSGTTASTTTDSPQRGGRGNQRTSKISPPPVLDAHNRGR
jgi:tetratricopeptide (TPR) repeat protein